MKKLILPLLLCVGVLLSACDSAATDAVPTEYLPLTQVDYYVLEPDERAVMTDAALSLYHGMVDALLSGGESAPAAESVKDNDFLLDLLHQHPCYFFLDSVTVSDGLFRFSYAYPQSERDRMLAVIDEGLLEVVNHDITPSDNELDVILKLYHAVTMFEYDHDREDNKTPDSPLMRYPGDEVYKTFRDGKGLCYSFAYIFRLALQQRGIDCFVIRGVTGEERVAHTWDMFCYDGAYFYCDPAWDRARDAYSRLIHFGKTDDERAADNVTPQDFASYHEEDFGSISCTDTRFSILRGITRFSPAGNHSFLVEDYHGNQQLLDTQTLTIQ